MTSVKMIHTLTKSMIGEREYVVIDLDDEEYCALLDDDEHEDIYNEIVNLIVTNRAKDIFLPSTTAKGAKMAELVAMAARMKKDADDIIGNMIADEAPCGFLSAVLFGEHPVDENGTKMMRAYAQIERGGKMEKITVEWFPNDGMFTE